MMPLK